MRLEGGCYCGEVRYVAEGDPMMQAQCHCRECQYISGGAPNTFIAMPAAGFSYITGQPKQFTRKDLERAVTREFCAECGTHLVTKVPGLPAAILKVGTLDEPDAVPSADGDLHLRQAGVPRDPGGHDDVREAAGALGAPISEARHARACPACAAEARFWRGEGPGMNVLGYGRMGRGWPDRPGHDGTRARHASAAIRPHYSRSGRAGPQIQVTEMTLDGAESRWLIAS